MSKYSDKKHVPPQCSLDWCDFLGDVIRVKDGQADWFCIKHDPESPTRKKSNGEKP